MNEIAQPVTSEPRIDAFARRLNLYTAAIVSVGMLIAIGGALAARAFEKGTARIQADLQSTNTRVEKLETSLRAQARSDSLRFERSFALQELAVAALIEPIGSTDQRSAVAELRRRRHVTPRPLEE